MHTCEGEGQANRHAACKYQQCMLQMGGAASRMGSAAPSVRVCWQQQRVRERVQGGCFGMLLVGQAAAPSSTKQHCHACFTRQRVSNTATLAAHCRYTAEQRRRLHNQLLHCQSEGCGVRVLGVHKGSVV
jgi:negative regulator of sigma E activity